MPLIRPDILIFFHIGKTGGMTLRNILDRNFPEEERFNGTVGETRSALGVRPFAAIAASYRELPEERRRAIRMAGGHVPMGIHTLFDRPARYLTLLRDPVDRVVSSFYYLRGIASLPFHPAIKDFEIDEYIESRLGLDPFDYQVRVVSGAAELDAEWSDLKPLDVAPVGSAHLELAKRNLEQHFLFAGTTEGFSAAVMILRRLYGWRFGDVLFRKDNVTERRPRLLDLRDTTIANIRRHNVHDQALYAWVDARFRALVRTLGVGFRLEVTAFEGLNRVFQKGGRTDRLERWLERMEKLFR
jgi:hypothetical protein